MKKDRWGFIYTETIFNYLTLIAKRHEIVLYSDVADDVGGNRRNLGARELTAIWHLCEERNWPHLNALVVGVINGLPGIAYTPDGKPVNAEQYKKIRQDIYEFDWTDKHL